MDSSESVGLAEQKLLEKTNISAHQSDENSTDDTPETMEILLNPNTKNDAQNAEGYVRRAKETLNQIKCQHFCNRG